MINGNYIMLDEALTLASYGLAVFPLKSFSKEPLSEHGYKDATTDTAQIKALWTRYPNANIGIACGSRSGGLIVVDCDRNHAQDVDGVHELVLYEQEHGEFPETWTCLTGSGGEHFYFRASEEISSRVGVLEGVDIRAEGGYVVAPPSLHQNGNRYLWELGLDDCEIATANESVLTLAGARKEYEPFRMPERIGEGRRNKELSRGACSMQSHGWSDAAILAAVRAENTTRCEPPLPDDEIVRLVSGICKRYPKGGAESWLKKQRDLLNQEEALLKQKLALLK